MTSLRQLFGGAISCGIDDRFHDVSAFRQIPDHQEVFADPNSDQSVIVEILQYEGEVRNDDSAKFFFHEIAESNGIVNIAQDVRIDRVEQLSAADAPHIGKDFAVMTISGAQKVAKFKDGENAKNEVMVYLANIRLPHKTTDIVISVNIPVQVSAESSSRSAVVPGDDRNVVGQRVLRRVLETFQIKDWSLFG